jgi:iron complex transport system ATP-binding protein
VSHVAKRDVAQLSDGERQRVMIARALAQEPVLLILDEPTAFLDVPSRVELMSLLRRLTREASLAVVVSTHDLELALRAADVVWLILPGGEIANGAPEDVIVSGAIADAFAGRHIRFDAEDRAFRWLSGERGGAAVTGAGLPAAMARAVLEREGFALRDEGSEPGTVAVSVTEFGWRLHSVKGDLAGDTFRALAKCLSALRTEHGLGVQEGKA